MKKKKTLAQRQTGLREIMQVEDISIESPKIQREKKRMKNNRREYASTLEEMTKCVTVIMGILEKEVRKKEGKELFEAIMSEHFLKLIQIQIQI